MFKQSYRFLPVFLLFSAVHVSARTGVAPGVPVASSIQPAPEAKQSWKSFPSYLVQDQKAIWSSPFHMSRADAKWWAIFGAAGAGLVAGDKWAFKQLPHTNTQISAGKWGSKFGALYTLVPLDAGLYSLGVLKHDDHLRETGFLGAEALGGAFIVDTVLKGITQRQRPTEGNGSGSFLSGKGRVWNSGSSFPSGHSIQTWALASVIAHEYSRSHIVPVAAYGIAATVSLSRIAAQKHFPSDVVVGAAMGWFIGHYVYEKHHATGPNSKIGRVLSHLQPAGAGVGLGGSF